MIIHIFLWVSPLRRKSEVFAKFIHFTSYVKNQFNSTIKSFQCDNGGEYNNADFQNYFDSNGINVRFSCAYISQQNGKSERMIRTINNAIRALLFQAKLKLSYWVEALHVAAHLLNILPSSSIASKSPFSVLFNKDPTYDHLRVFGCLCFPNINNFTTHKLSARSTPCLFLGYPHQHQGYRCLNLKTNKIIISRHVVFDESTFPAAKNMSLETSKFDFLDTANEPSLLFRSILQNPAETQAPHAPLILPQPAPPSPVPILTQPIVLPRHSMKTRSHTGATKPKKAVSLLTTTFSSLPKTHQKALKYKNWNPAMIDEYDAQIKNKTWSLVPRPEGANIINSMWLFKHKYRADGSLKRYKARLVANGKSQEAGVDYDEMFSPVVKPATIRTVVDVGLSRNWEINQLDVKNAFLHGTISETIYMHQPPGFVDKSHPHHVCKLEKSIYGLKQAPRAWNARFTSYISKLEFQTSKCDPSLFIYKKGNHVAYLLLYVDDIIITGSSKALIAQLTLLLKNEFPMTDMGRLTYFLGIKVDYNRSGIFLSQEHYAQEIIERAGMINCKPLATPLDVNSKLSTEAGDKIPNVIEYRSLAGALQYLTFTRPDITYVVQQVCLFMHDPRLQHLQALK